MTPEAWVLAAIGLAITVLGTVAVYRGGQGDRIDRKRDSEITRLDARLTRVENDSRLVAGVAWRAVRYIEAQPGAQPFPIDDEEREALERTRPLGADLVENKERK